MARLSSGRANRLQPKLLLPKVHIFVEGLTEWHYFNGFKPSLRGAGIVINIPKPSHGRAGSSLVVEAINYLEHHERDEGDHVFVVFDRDANIGVPSTDIEQAFKLAEDNDIEVIFSDDAFELWPVLHYQDLKRHTTRCDLNALLTKHFGVRYERPAKDMFDTLMSDPSRLPLAIERAKKLALSKGNPSTDVYKLVDFLQSKSK